MAVTFHKLTRSLPLDIDAKVSYYNLSPAPTVIASPNVPASEEPASASTPSPIKSVFAGTSSALEHLYNATDGTKNFSKVVDFLGTMAEAESFKGKQTYSLSSSASGIFHFLTGNGGGHNKAGVKENLGQYDAQGVLRTSSFETAKKRLRSMMQNPKYSDSIKQQPGLTMELDSVLEARTPDDLTPQKQAILAYANLKMQSSDFSRYLQGKQEASDVYGRVWVTRGSTHSDGSIKANWQNAIKRSVNQKSNYDFFGLKPIDGTFGSGPSQESYGAYLPGIRHDGGTLDQRIHQKKTLI